MPAQHASTSGQRQRRRPLSPHLQIYRPNLTMVMSILHRITGAVLYFSTFLGVWWLMGLASGPKYFAYVNGMFRSWPALIILFAVTYQLFHHAFGGIRHLVWDSGRGFSVRSAERLGLISLALAIISTALVWFLGWWT